MNADEFVFLKSLLNGTGFDTAKVEQVITIKCMLLDSPNLERGVFMALMSDKTAAEWYDEVVLNKIKYNE